MSNYIRATTGVADLQPVTHLNNSSDVGIMVGNSPTNFGSAVGVISDMLDSINQVRTAIQQIGLLRDIAETTAAIEAKLPIGFEVQLVVTNNQNTNQVNSNQLEYKVYSADQQFILPPVATPRPINITEPLPIPTIPPISIITIKGKMPSVTTNFSDWITVLMDNGTIKQIETLGLRIGNEERGTFDRLNSGERIRADTMNKEERDFFDGRRTA